MKQFIKCRTNLYPAKYKIRLESNFINSVKILLVGIE